MGLRHSPPDSQTKVRDLWWPWRTLQIPKITRGVDGPSALYLSRSGSLSRSVDQIVDYRLTFNTKQNVLGLQICNDQVESALRT